MYNRWSDVGRPSDWGATHDPKANPGKNPDWFLWHIAVFPFSDMIRLYAEGDIGTGQAALDKMQALFDLSATELTQLQEVWTSFINTDGTLDTQLKNIERMQSFLRVQERDIPAQFVADPKTYLYTKFGITAADDR
jgi:hypothetical protein